MSNPDVDRRRAALDAIEQLATVVARALRRAEVSGSASNPMTGTRDWEDRSTVSAQDEIETSLRTAADEVERVPAALRDNGSSRGVLDVWTQTIFGGHSGKFVAPGWRAVGSTAAALTGGYYLLQAAEAYRADDLDLALLCATEAIGPLAT
jgi:hypothetical protein